MKTSDLKEKAQEWQRVATERVRNAGEVTDSYIRENTWTTLTLAAVVGCMLGYFIANSRRD
jgi:ElaB/YqjD/DUF883 family membrane-anchored ribosome-binding protein